MVVLWMLGVDSHFISRTVGFGGGGWPWGPVGVHHELLGQIHVAGFGCSLAQTTQPGKTLINSQINPPLQKHLEKQLIRFSNKKSRGEFCFCCMQNA